MIKEARSISPHLTLIYIILYIHFGNRQKSSGAEGERLKEATNINKSLSTLGLVILLAIEFSSITLICNSPISYFSCGIILKI